MKRYLAVALLAIGGCGGESGGGDVNKAEGELSYYAVNRLKVPMSAKDYAVDLNGDARKDNQLGNIVAALIGADMSGNLNPQSSVDESVMKGSVVLLASVQAASLSQADSVGVTVYLGQETMMPDFASGMGMFAVDASQMPAKFFGRINAKKMLSNNPVTTKSPVSIVLRIPLVGNQMPLALKLNGGHVQFNTGTDMASGKPGLLDGEIHGSIKHSDITGTIIPTVASLLTDQVKKACSGMSDGGMGGADGGSACSGSGATIKQIFDIGCMDKNAATAGDNVIAVCEVAENGLIMNVLLPDVQIFDAMGNYAPSKENKTKDSISLGLGFEAVQSGKFGGI